MTRALGHGVTEPAGALAYHIGVEKVMAWNRQWQCDVLTRLTHHVSVSAIIVLTTED